MSKIHRAAVRSHFNGKISGPAIVLLTPFPHIVLVTMRSKRRREPVVKALKTGQWPTKTLFQRHHVAPRGVLSMLTNLVPSSALVSIIKAGVSGVNVHRGVGWRRHLVKAEGGSTMSPHHRPRRVGDTHRHTAIPQGNLNWMGTST